MPAGTATIEIKAKNVTQSFATQICVNSDCSSDDGATDSAESVPVTNSKAKIIQNFAPLDVAAELAGGCQTGFICDRVVGENQITIKNKTIGKNSVITATVGGNSDDRISVSQTNDVNLAKLFIDAIKDATNF